MGAQTPARDEILRAMRKAADFYRSKVSTEGGYHYYYTADLSYGRSESAEGPTQVEVQREATPVATLAYLDAMQPPAIAHTSTMPAPRRKRPALIPSSYGRFGPPEATANKCVRQIGEVSLHRMLTGNPSFASLRGLPQRRRDQR